MSSTDAPKIPEPIDVKKIKSRKKHFGAGFLTSLIVMVAVTLIPDLIAFSETVDSTLSALSCALLIPVGGYFLAIWKGPDIDITPLEGKNLKKMVALTEQHPELMEFAYKIKADQRKPVVDELTLISRYCDRKQEYEQNQAAEAQWEALQP